MGKVAIVSVSRKQKLDMKISTDAELVGADEASSQILWANLLMKLQGYEAEQLFLSR